MRKPSDLTLKAFKAFLDDVMDTAEYPCACECGCRRMHKNGRELICDECIKREDANEPCP